MFKTIKKNLSSPDSLISLVLGIAVVITLGTLIVRYIKNRAGNELDQARQEEQLKSAKLPIEYTVVAGDNLWTISENLYKSGYNWVDIANANSLSDANYVEVGQKLIIPDVKPITIPGQISSDQTTMIKPKVATYTVKPGDNLWDITVAQYGNGFLYTKVSEANHLANPGIIHAGNILTLPTIP